jgi:hypothetical protein
MLPPAGLVEVMEHPGTAEHPGAVSKNPGSLREESCSSEEVFGSFRRIRVIVLLNGPGADDA